MGNKETAANKWAGYRVLNIKPNSPLENFLSPYFDYIIDAIAQVEPSPKDILGKLTGQSTQAEVTGLARLQNFIKNIKQHEGKQVMLKVYSSKTNAVRDVKFVPRSDWGGSQQLFGVVFRLQRYDIAQDLFCQVGQVKPNSPCFSAGIVPQEYLIGVKEFRYESLTDLTDSLYELYFNKEISQKIVHFLVYNIKKDALRSVAIELRRKWGGEGLLGCEFLQGHLYKFPKNFEETRKKAAEAQKNFAQLSTIRKQLMRPDQSSRLLAEALKKRASEVGKKNKRIVIRPLQPQTQHMETAKVTQQPEVVEAKTENRNFQPSHETERIQKLQEKVAQLQTFIKQMYEAIIDYNSQVETNAQN